jgi:hypothetical protein
VRLNSHQRVGRNCHASRSQGPATPRSSNLSPSPTPPLPTQPHASEASELTE